MSEETLTEDRTTIGVSVAGGKCLDLLMSKGWFDQEVVAFRVAVAYALANDLNPTVGETYTTKWNRGTLEQGTLLADLISLLRPSTRPYDLAQGLGDAGLKAMAEKARAGEGLPAMLGF